MSQLSRPTRTPGGFQDHREIVIYGLNVPQRGCDEQFPVFVIRCDHQSWHCKPNKRDGTQCPRKRTANLFIKNVETIESLLRKRKIDVVKQAEYVLFRHDVESEQAERIPCFHGREPASSCILCIEYFGIQIGRYKPRFAFSGVLALFVNGFREPISISAHCIHSERRYRSDHYRCEGKDGAPRLPPNMAVLRQRPTLAYAIQHAHSLIPLWIGGHFAMGAQRAAA